MGMTSDSALLHTVLKPGHALVAMAHMEVQANKSQGIMGNTFKGPPFSFIIFIEVMWPAPDPRSVQVDSALNFTSLEREIIRPHDKWHRNRNGQKCQNSLLQPPY